MYKSLIVDGSPIVRRTLCIILTQLGFIPTEAAGSATAIELCQNSLPDLVMIDWTPPDDDGITLAQQLRRLPGGEKMKLIMCTTERSVAHIETALAAGADEYVTKPFGLDILETKLGYLGFEIAALPADTVSTRRHLSRVGFAGMSVAESDAISFDAGDVIFAPGDPPDFAYIILSGQIEIRRQTREGPSSGIVYGPYDLFGDLALIETAPRPYIAIALTKCSVIRIARGPFQAELALLSPFMRNWVECLSDQAISSLEHRRKGFSTSPGETQ
jgi:two-component system chemotaxis response regulator CheY